MEYNMNKHAKNDLSWILSKIEVFQISIPILDITALNAITKKILKIIATAYLINFYALIV